jgi:ubiquinone/menaquinone biosynthesis C-methylase UbiE
MSSDEPSHVAETKRQLSGIFDRAAATYDHVGPRVFSHFGRRLVELAQIPRGARVLDVATGRGAVLLPAAESVGTQGHVTGIDLSEVMVQETTRELARRRISLNVEVHLMDAEHLQFPNELFDYVLSGFSLFFFPQLDLAMSEFRRVLKCNGQIGVTTWHKSSEEQSNWFNKIVRAYLPPEPEALQSTESASRLQPGLNTPEGLESVMNAAGFTDIQVVSEAMDFTYATEEEFWMTLWSHGSRGTLERIERTTGSEGLQRFKADVLKGAETLKQGDGVHQLLTVLFALATKPRS